MSRLEWPTNLGVANGFATAAAEQRGTVYPHHVVLADGSNRAGTDITGTTFSDLKVVGVSLDRALRTVSDLPLSWPETRKPGAEPPQKFAYAITGVVPVVVPSGVLENARLGQPLYITDHDPKEPYFGDQEHKAPRWTLDKTSAKKVGVIVGLGGKMENHCLIVLSYW